MTAELIPAGASEFETKFTRFRRSAFRLETLQSYGNSGEDAELAAFLAGERQPPPDELHRWWHGLLRAAVRDGRTMQRVHIVTEPLSEYLSYELTWAYGPNVAAGEDIRIIAVPTGEAWLAWLPPMGTDFWLFDSTDLYQQRYDPDGTWLGTLPVDDPGSVAVACEWRDVALRQATPWAKYVSSRPELMARLETATR